MAQETLRVGIVGAHPERGWAQAAHIPALRALPGFRITAVATTRRDSAEATARQHGIPLAFDDWRALVAHPEVDVVLVAVKVAFHRDIVLAAAEAGKHVFCEWPLGLDAAEAQAMRDAAAARAIRHMVGLQGRVHPVLERARALVAEGAIGEVISCTLLASLNNWGPVQPASEAYRLDARQGATALTVPGGHSLDALRFCLGEFADVSAIVTTQHRDATIAGTGERVAVTSPDQVLVSGRLASGAVASVHVKADIHAPTGLRFEVNGTRGDLVVATRPPVGAAPVGIQRAVLTLDGALHGSKSLAPIEVPMRGPEMPAGVPDGPPLFAARLLQRLGAAIRDGGPLTPDFGTALSLHRLLEAVAAASSTSRRHRLGADGRWTAAP